MSLFFFLFCFDSKREAKEWLVRPVDNAYFFGKNGNLFTHPPFFSTKSAQKRILKFSARCRIILSIYRYTLQHFLLVLVRTLLLIWGDRYKWGNCVIEIDGRCDQLWNGWGELGATAANKIKFYWRYTYMVVGRGGSRISLWGEITYGWGGISKEGYEMPPATFFHKEN